MNPKKGQTWKNNDTCIFIEDACENRGTTELNVIDCIDKDNKEAPGHMFTLAEWAIFVEEKKLNLSS